MKKVLGLFILLFWPIFCVAKNDITDSLINSGKKILNSDPHQGIQYLEALLQRNPKIPVSKKGLINAAIGSGYAMMGDYNNAESHMLSASKQLNGHPSQFYALRNLAAVYTLTASYRRADSLFRLLIKNIPEVPAQYGLKASLMCEYSDVFSNQGQNTVAIDLLKRSITYCYKIRDIDSTTIGIIRAKLARIYFSLEKYSLASRELEIAISMTDPSKSLYNYCTTVLGLAHSLLEEQNPVKAAPWIKVGFESCHQLNNTELLGYAMMLYGCYYDLIQAPNQALDRFKAAFSMLREHKSSYLFDCATAYLNFLTRNGHYNQAAQLLKDPVLDSVMSNQIPPHVLKFKLAALPVIERLYSSDHAIRAYNEIIDLQDSVNRIKLSQSLIDSRAEFRMLEQEREKQRLEQQNMLLGQENDIRKGQVLLAIACSIAAFFIIMFLVVRYRNSSIKQKLELEQSRQELLSKDNMLKIEAELRSMREHIIEQQKQELRTSITEIEQLKNEIGQRSDANQQELEDLFARHLTDSRHRINLEQFLQRFNKIYPQFFQNLTQMFPGLSTSDLQFCALLKMNYPIKDISTILNIEQKSTYTKKYRIEEKMKLSDTSSLEQVVFGVPS